MDEMSNEEDIEQITSETKISEADLEDLFPHKEFYNKRDQLTNMLINHMLVGSWRKYRSAHRKYPFVPTRSLRPRSMGDDKPEKKMGLHHDGFILFTAGSLSEQDMEYILFENQFKVNKETLVQNKFDNPSFLEDFDINCTYFEDETLSRFEKAVMTLSEEDSALLIQADSKTKELRYALTHYMVKVDWSKHDAKRALAKRTGYITARLSELDRDIRQELGKKLLERYGFPRLGGNRSIAAAQAAEYLTTFTKDPFAVYVQNQESRTLSLITPDFVSKYVLVKMPTAHMTIARSMHNNFNKNFIYGQNVAVLRVDYQTTDESKTWEGEIRELQSQKPWLIVENQSLVPKRNSNANPITYNVVYDKEDPFLLPS